ncbi:hypothetical protein NDU88_007145 [Pleurodeles waltl]|uniref:Uncharacterized protein n=1 Tax=Pleurodeles waltl TaxID=8319 RepID=A0AAV7NS97_PLEWA|nr:hypothetical protein NDU88_007145 [Pleurodeles waltl]
MNPCDTAAQTSHCEFDKFDNEAAIQLRILEGCHSTGFRTKLLKETYMLDKILTMARSEARATAHAIHMENGRVQMIEPAHCMSGSSSRQDKPSLPQKAKHERICCCCGLEQPHIGTCSAMGHKCQKRNCDNHFASICMGGHIKAKRGRLARPRIISSRHA